MPSFRCENDLLGPCDVPAQALYGIHTERAIENFPLAHRPVHRGLTHAYGAVKLASSFSASVASTLGIHTSPDR